MSELNSLRLPYAKPLSIFGNKKINGVAGLPVVFLEGKPWDQPELRIMVVICKPAQAGLAQGLR